MYQSFKLVVFTTSLTLIELAFANKAIFVSLALIKTANRFNAATKHLQLAAVGKTVLAWFPQFFSRKALQLLTSEKPIAV